MFTQRITTIIFDWGDTLMKDFAEFSGPMVDWPRVEIVEGVLGALEGLKGTYRIALATSAAVSGESRVRGALRRVGIEGYFDVVFTARELGMSKTDPAYYPAVIEGLGCAPDEAVMVGDQFAGDVRGPKAAGLRAIWYNPDKKACPGNDPVADVELMQMKELPEVMASKWLPDVETCMEWIAEQGSPARLVGHVRNVARAAYLMAVKLRIANVDVSPWLAHRGGLLHDLDKLTFRESGLDHGEQSFEILAAKGEPELAEIARRHLMGRIQGARSGPQTWEQKLVFYADKLVEQDQIVPLDERLKALKNRYPSYADEITACEPLILDLEKEICTPFQMDAAELNGWLKAELNQD